MRVTVSRTPRQSDLMSDTVNSVRAGIAVFLLAGLLGCSPSLAAETESDKSLQDIERALQLEQQQSEELRRKSEDLRRDLADIAHKMVNAAKTIQEHERNITELELKIAELRLEETGKAAELIAQREQFARVLMSLERLARFPPEAMIAQPTSPSDTVRSAILLRSVVPEIERRAERLRQQIESLAISRDRMKEQQAALRLNMESLAKEGQTLGALQARNKLLKKATDSEQEKATSRVKKLAREAETLRDLMARLREDQQPWVDEEAQPRTTEDKSSSTAAAPSAGLTQPAILALPSPSLSSADLTGVPISTRQGQLPFPVIGQVVGRYGENNENGVTRRGIEITTRPAAQVISPYEGKVVFVGEFRGYGQLLIIEHSEGYHSLLAGMARIDSAMGQWLLVGEPVGIMESAPDAKPVLYVEIRQDGQPVNPLSWLSSRTTSTQG